jgi:hypothetical protein
VLRSHTPVAASPSVDVTLIPTIQQTVELWKLAIRDFALVPAHVKAFNTYFSDNMRPILEDARHSMCTPYHACAEKDKEYLDNLLGEAMAGKQPYK